MSRAIAFGCGGDWRCLAGGIFGRVRAAARPECLTKLKDVRQGITKKASCCRVDSRHCGAVRWLCKLRCACFSFVRQADLAAAPALRMMPGLWLRWSNAIALAPLFQPRLDFPHFTRSGSQSLRMVLPVRHGFTPASVRCPDIENPPLSMRGPAMNARLGYECAARL